MRRADTVSLLALIAAFGPLPFVRAGVLTLWLLPVLVSDGSSREACVDYGSYIHTLGETEDTRDAQQIAVGDEVALIVSSGDGQVLSMRVAEADPDGFFEMYSFTGPSSAAAFLFDDAWGEAFAIATDDWLLISVIDPVLLDGIDGASISHGHGMLERLAATPNRIHAIDRTGNYLLFSYDSEIHSLALPARPVGLAADGLTAYVTLESDELVVIDASLPAIVGTLALSRPRDRIAVSNGFAYLANVFARDVDVVDVSDPASPVLLGSWTTSGGDVATHDGFVFHGGRIYDVADPMLPVIIGQFPNGSHNVLGVGSGRVMTSLYGSSAIWSLPVTDVDPVESVPTSASLPLGDVATDVGGNAGLLAVTHETSGLALYDISDPDAPAPRGSLALPGAAGVVGVANPRLRRGWARLSRGRRVGSRRAVPGGHRPVDRAADADSALRFHRAGRTGGG